ASTPPARSPSLRKYAKDAGFSSWKPRANCDARRSFGHGASWRGTSFYYSRPFPFRLWPGAENLQIRGGHVPRNHKSEKIGRLQGFVRPCRAAAVWQTPSCRIHRLRRLRTRTNRSPFLPVICGICENCRWTLWMKHADHAVAQLSFFLL